MRTWALALSVASGFSCASEVTPKGAATPPMSTAAATAAPSAAVHAQAVAKPSRIELRVTDEVGRVLDVSVKDEAFVKCLVVAEPGERGYALFVVHLRDLVPDPRALTESEGLGQPTLDCIRNEIARYDEPGINVRRTLWYFSVGP